MHQLAQQIARQPSRFNVICFQCERVQGDPAQPPYEIHDESPIVGGGRILGLLYHDRQAMKFRSNIVAIHSNLVTLVRGSG
ncbi:hypothetical protein A5710_20800 [Mycolicibacter sinensis]|uniref:Uncharacterized protein n=1 Tax=Mycolicibacter sinensis (strain JDM601) TaxID=875328 RepID=A0A1A2XY74_MYCSD|nr:hypothetical protein A5710_20800 [Mycolicibacter sinensis]